MAAAKARGDISVLRSDPLVLKLVSENERQLRDFSIPKIAVNFWRKDVSFAWNLLRKGDPFAQMTTLLDKAQSFPYDRDHYSDDFEFQTAAAELRQSKSTKIILVHIPTYNEMIAHPDGGFEFGAHGVPPSRGESLVDDLQQHLDQRWVELYQFYPSALKEKPADLVYSQQDSHPNPLGVQAMADALERLLRTDARTAHLFTPKPDDEYQQGLTRDSSAPPPAQAR
jgi:hypothetical protein